LVVVILWGGSGTWQNKPPMLIGRKPAWNKINGRGVGGE
ncbi:hypothetical protein T11_5270, partial [Trichinella zimbabwensis]